MPSKRIQEIDPSGIRRVFALAKTLKNPCNRSIGQPHFDVPEPLKQAAINAIKQGKNSYTSTEGIDELREALHASYAKKGAPQEAVFVTSAVSGGFLLALIATCDVGDEIIIPDPYFVMWKDLPTVFGVRSVTCNTYPDLRWHEEPLRRAITDKTRAIVVCSPMNPTGIAMTEEEIKMIARVAAEHNLWVIYDEIYEAFSYDHPHYSMSAYYPKTITLGGSSKSLSMTGWRIGSAAGPKDIIEQMIKLQQFTFICAPSMAQWAALEGVNYPLDSISADYKRKRDLMVANLKGHYTVVQPEGAFYLFPEAPRGMSGTEFVHKALERNLIVIPGNVFSGRDTHFRLSYAQSDAVLERGIEILIQLANL